VVFVVDDNAIMADWLVLASFAAKRELVHLLWLWVRLAVSLLKGASSSLRFELFDRLEIVIAAHLHFPVHTAACLAHELFALYASEGSRFFFANITFQLSLGRRESTGCVQETEVAKKASHISIRHDRLLPARWALQLLHLVLLRKSIQAFLATCVQAPQGARNARLIVRFHAHIARNSIFHYRRAVGFSCA
jgi:hypothetical protein